MLSDDTIEKLAKAFVCVKVDCNSDAGLSEQMGVSYVPHDRLVAPDGTVLYQKVSPELDELKIAMRLAQEKTEEAAH